MGSLGSGGDPGLVFAQKIPDSLEQWSLIALEIEVENDQRPVSAVILAERLLHDGADAFEKVLAERGLGAGGLGSVGDYRSALAGCRIDAPGQVLFNRDRKAERKSAIDSVGPAAFVW